MIKKEKNEYRFYSSVSKPVLIAGAVALVIALIIFIVRCVRNYAFLRLDSCILLAVLLGIDIYFIIKPPKDKLKSIINDEIFEVYLDNGKIKTIYLDEVDEFSYKTTDVVNDVFVKYLDKEKDPDQIRLFGVSKFQFANIANNILRKNYMENKNNNINDVENVNNVDEM